MTSRSSIVTSPDKSVAAAPSPRSLMTRVTAPFASKQQHHVKQEIRLDEPFRQFFSGDSVKGAVHIKTSKPLRITHIVVRLHGFVKVVNTSRQPGEDIPYDENLLASMRSRRGIEYFGNGFARLFEDECILCGDGKLSGEYQFRFDLHLPSKNIPSSIDFEHGTVRYLLSSTLTRPTAILPTINTHRKLNVTGTLDIAHLHTPRIRTVSLEAIGKKGKPRVRIQTRATLLERAGASASSSIDENHTFRTAATQSQAGDIPPQSPVPSIVSSASAGSSTLSANNMVLRPVTTVSTDDHSNPLGAAVSHDKTITAQTALLRGGCLPGDIIPIRINIDHTKPVKTMQGLIITIYRQGRIDTHPDIPLGPLDSAGRQRYEDYYPRSRTGLGGLSLSSAGSSRLFRQDLAQTITPLIIDPRSLTAIVNTSIQMPDHVFPTISCVPGSMISFKYFVEIVIDLRGKQAGQDRFMPSLSIVNAPQHAYGDAKVSRVDGVNGTSYSATPGFHYLITDQIRRIKGVVCTTTEVIVGTWDSTRARGKKKNEDFDPNQDRAFSHFRSDEDYPYDTIEEGHPTSGEADQTEQQTDWPSSFNGSRPSQPPLLQPSEFDESVDEKTRLRRAEQRLLPSAPDMDASSHAMAPSAPFAFDEEDFMQRYGYGPPAPAYEGASVSPQMSARTTVPIVVDQRAEVLATEPDLNTLDMNAGRRNVEEAVSSKSRNHTEPDSKPATDEPRHSVSDAERSDNGPHLERH